MGTDLTSIYSSNVWILQQAHIGPIYARAWENLKLNKLIIIIVYLSNVVIQSLAYLSNIHRGNSVVSAK